jgi:hypothetical protein
MAPLSGSTVPLEEPSVNQRCPRRGHGQCERQAAVSPATRLVAGPLTPAFSAGDPFLQGFNRAHGDVFVQPDLTAAALARARADIPRGDGGRTRVDGRQRPIREDRGRFKTNDL